MARYKHATTGALVGVRDDKVLGSEWERLDAEPTQGYAGQKVAELREEIGRRNEGRDEDDLLSTEGNKAALVAILEADDE